MPVPSQRIAPSYSSLGLLAALLIAAWSCAPATAPGAAPSQSLSAERGEAGTARLEVLFLGDGGHHQPAERLRDIATPMLNRGIALYYT